MKEDQQQQDNDNVEQGGRVQPKLKWSLNVGGNDDVLFQIPRSSRSALSLIDDHWCQVPTFTSGAPTRSETWRQQSTVEVAIFVPSSSSHNQIELTIHDPKRELSSSYQLGINDVVSKMQLVPLPPGFLRKNQLSREATNQELSKLEAFGVLLVLATRDVISVFSLVFVVNGEEHNNFVLSECVELSDNDNEANINDKEDSNVLLKDRRIREMKIKLVSTPRKQSTLGRSEERMEKSLLVVTSSIPWKSKSTPSSSQNVDSFVFPLKDHICPMFRYETTNRTKPMISSSLNLLQDIRQVRDIIFLGDTLSESAPSLVVCILLAGELKLIPMRGITRQHTATMKVQTILLAGVCAHPSISGLGEAMMIESIDTSTDNTSTTSQLAILCRPKIGDNIGFKATTTTTPANKNAFLSTRRQVSFSPFDSIQDLDAASTSKITNRFFPTEKQTPGPKSEYQQTHEYSNEERQKVGGVTLISPDSNEGNNEFLESTDEPASMSMMTDSSMLTSASALVGLHLVGTPHPPDNDKNRLQMQEEPEVLDLTGKFARSVDADPLSPLSGLLLDQSLDESYYEMPSAIPSHRTPINIPTKQLGPRSAIKSIQCTTPMNGTSTSTSQNPDYLPHVIVVKVEQTCMDAGESSDQPLKFGLSVTPLPSSVKRFDFASMKWICNDNWAMPKLFIATSDARPTKPSLQLTEICYRKDEDPALKLVEVTRCTLQPILDDLKSQRGECDFVIKAISLCSTSWPETEENPLGLQLLLSRQVKQKKQNADARSPINISSMEDALICMASTSLPLVSLQRRASTTKAEQNLDRIAENVAVMQKLDDVLQYMQTLEEKVETGMAKLERRLGVVEEAMRTV